MKTAINISILDLSQWAALQRETILDFVSEAQPEELPSSFVSDLAYSKALSNLLDSLIDNNGTLPADLLSKPQSIELEL